jgi:broad-specificity NMP kinase
MKVFCTGASGSGKTSVAKRIDGNIVSLDLDTIGITLLDGKPKPDDYHVSDIQSKQEFFDRVSYEIDLDELQRMINDTEDAGLDFIACGVAMNWEDVINHFDWDEVILLDMRDESVEAHLRAPDRSNPWGQLDWQVEEAVHFAQTLRKDPRFTIVIEEQPLPDVVEEIRGIFDKTVEDETGDEDNMGTVND